MKSRVIFSQEEFKRKLRKFNLKVTLHRMAVFEILQKSRNHPDAETVYKMLKKQYKYISLATVYNTLREFSRVGVIQEIALPDGIRRFDTDLSLHIHLICRCCHKIVDFDNSYENLVKDILKLREKIKLKSGFTTLNINLSFSGICHRCREN